MKKHSNAAIAANKSLSCVNKLRTFVVLHEAMLRAVENDSWWKAKQVKAVVEHALSMGIIDDSQYSLVLDLFIDKFTTNHNS